MQWDLTRLALQAARRILEPPWRPKTLQNRGQNAKKSMLKKGSFFVSIFGRFGRRFGRVFGRFFEAKMHSKTDVKKSVRHVFRIVNYNTKRMSALLRQTPFRAKIEEKLRIFWGCDFECILGGFWEAKIIDFRICFDVFSI